MPSTVAATHVAAASEYCAGVETGRIVACRWVKLAVQRHLRDLKRFAKDGPYVFDAAAAERVCGIIERFPHIKGIWAQHRHKLTLQPWQTFILCSVFGWKRREDNLRRFRTVYTEVARKNGKSSWTSGIGLYLLACDDEQGAHIVSAANTRDQAKIIFGDAQQMARKEPGFCGRFGIEVLAHTIVQVATASKFEALSAEYSNLDGLNLHAALIDELHAHPTRGVWDILETATGARAQPLIWAITTAGTNRASVCWEQHRYVTQILTRDIEDETYFGIIYTIDDGDDPFDENAWLKANPNLGVSKYPEALRAEAARAQVMPSAQTAFFTKHLNIWVNADVAWLPAGAWDRLTDPQLALENYEGQPCYIGIDLAVRSDIAAMVLLFPPYGAHQKWAVFAKYYLPAETVLRDENAHYQGWERAGRLTVAGEAMTDFDFIIEDLQQWGARFEVREIASDPWRNVPFKMYLQKAGVTVNIVDVRQNTATMSPSMKELEGMILDQKITHDGDPVLSWMISNVVAHRDEKDNLYPQKDTQDKKIDGVLALLMALDRAMRGAAVDIDWEKRPGLWSI